MSRLFVIAHVAVAIAITVSCILVALALEPCATEDRRARVALLKLIQEAAARDAEPHEEFAIPDIPTGLQRDYTVVLYGQSGNQYGSRINVEVCGDLATAEMMTEKGIFRGEFPSNAVDHLARQVWYAHQIVGPRTILHPREVSYGCGGIYPASQGIAITSQDAAHPFAFQTTPRELRSNEIQLYTKGIQTFAETQLARSLEHVATGLARSDTVTTCRCSRNFDAIMTARCFARSCGPALNSI